jgi:hypothetical protein
MPDDPTPPPEKSRLQRFAERRDRKPQPVGSFARNLILISGIAFCLLFAVLTIAVAVDSGVNLLILTSLGIIVMVLLGIVGAIRNPPE